MSNYLNENTCTCCGKKWSSNKIIKIIDYGWFRRPFQFWGWVEGYSITYQLICKECNIETPFEKQIRKDDFKPTCKNEAQV